MSIDLYHNVDILPGIPPETATDDTAFVSAILDTAGRESVVFAFSTGTLADAACTFTCLFEEGDDSGLSDNGAVADADLYGTEAGCAGAQTDDDTAYKIGYRGTKRYVRVTVTPADNASAFPLGGVWIVSNARKPPFSDQSDAT